MTMFRNYFVSSLRNLLRYKGYSLINILGLSIGITISVLIFLFVQDELSYDKHNEKFDRIYRVYLNAKIQDTEMRGAISNAPVGPTMVKEIPTVESYTRLFTFGGEPIVRYEDKSFIEKKLYFADSSFFEVFSLPVIEGNPKNFLKEPNSVVITEEIAHKYFGEENAVGKHLNMGEDKQAYEVVGVVRGFPKNSHFHFDLLTSGSTIFQNLNQLWVSNNNYTYVVLREGVSMEEVQEKLNDLVQKYVGPQMEQFIGISLEEMENHGQRYGYFLQPLKDIHLRSDLSYEIEAGGSLTTVIIFSIIALFIILIAAINFMNLATARSSVRALEVGIRKLVGSARKQLIAQFLIESVVLSFISLLLAVVLILLFMPFFNQFTGKSLVFSLASNPVLLPVLLCIWLIVGVLAGSYPAFFLASFQPIKVLKSSLKSGMKTPVLRSILVSFQFIITISLFVSTITVFRQMRLMEKKEMGFDKNDLLIVERAYVLRENTQAFKQEIDKLPQVQHSSYSNTYPGGLYGNTAFVPEGVSSSQTHAIFIQISDPDFAQTFQVSMAEGRWFSKEMPSDSGAIVLNEAAAKELGFEHPLEHRIIQVGDAEHPLKVIGVVKDFHFQSLHQTVKGLIIFHGQNNNNTMAIRLQAGNRAEALAAIENTWKKFTEEQPLNYVFLDDFLSTQYKAEKSTGLIFSVFSLLAILIASLGLLGLTSFSADQRTREIGIRKVMGASVSQIMAILSKEILWLVLIATLVSWPLSYYFMKDWLQDFAFRTNLSPFVFIGSSLLTYLIALITISYKTYRAASANPSDALRHE